MKYLSKSVKIFRKFRIEILLFLIMVFLEMCERFILRILLVIKLIIVW